MKFTNNHNLPESLFRALTKDHYDAGDRPSDISVTSLIGPPRIFQLKKRHADEITEDAADRVWSLLGHAAHWIAEQGEQENEINEQRLYMEIDGWVLSGMSDNYNAKTGIISDYKVTCLTPDTDVLVRGKGFVPIAKVVEGDEVVGYDHKSGIQFWDTVKKTHTYNAPEKLVRLKNSDIEFLCTEDHRWVTEYRILSYAGGKYRVTSKKVIKKAKDILSNHSIVCAAGSPVKNEEGIDATLDEIELIGWIFTDGWVNYSGNSVNAYISQKKEPYLSEIKNKFGHLFTKSIQINKNGVSQFRLKSQNIAPLFERLGIKDKHDIPAFVTRLNSEQRKAMMSVMQKAEGSIGGRYEQCGIPGPILDSYIILATLEGIRLGISDHPSGSKYIRHLKSLKMHHAGMNKELVSHDYKTVHCLTTGSGTFIMRRGNVVSITGNSVYSFRRGLKAEWEAQLNLLAMLRRNAGYDVKGIRIIAILRDYRESDRLRDPEYPLNPTQVIEVPLWDQKQALIFAGSRIRMHQAAAAQATPDLPLCTKEERWESETRWVVKGEGAKRAYRSFDNPKEAQEMADSMTNGKKRYVVEKVDGMPKRCLSYCNVCQFCDFGKEAKKKFEKSHEDA